MRRPSSRKLTLFSAGGLTLLAVVCSAISTYAWFTTNHNPEQAADIVSGSSSLALGAVTAYRDGYEPYTGADPSEEGDNDGDTSKDYTFDIPNGGVGFYLVPQDPTTKAYKYGNSGTLKLDQYSDSTIAMKKNVSLTQNKNYQFRKYTFENNETVNKPVHLSGEKTGNLTVSADGSYITVTTTGTYSVWLDYDRGEVGLEIVTPFTEQHVSSVEKGYLSGATPRKANTNYTTPAAGKKRIFLTNFFSNDPRIHYWGGSSASDWNTRPTMGYLYTNSFAQAVFYYDVPSDTTGVKFTNQDGTADSGADIDATTNNAFYKDGGGNMQGYRVENVTYYFYNFLDTGAFFSDTPKAYGQISYTWSGGDTNICRTDTNTLMTDEGDSVLSVTVPSFMTELVIKGTYKGASKTFTIGCEGKGGHYYVLSDANNGGWYDELEEPSGDPITYYLYDYSGIFSTHKCYYWKEGAANSLIHPGWPGVDMVAESTANLYSVSIPSDFDTIIFNNGSTGGANQTENFALDADRPYHVIDGRQDGESKYKVMNFVEVAGISATNNTYYVYDPEHKLGNAAPYAYAYIQTDINSDDYYYKTARDTFFITGDGEVRNGAWPGSQTSAAQISSTDVAGLYSIAVSESFTHVIFSNGADADSGNLLKTTDDAAVLESGKPYFVVGAAVEAGRFGGTWTEQIGVVTLKTKYSLYDSGTDTPLDFASKEIAKETVLDLTESYTPTASVEDEYIKDAANGIYYHFAPERDNGNIVWYDSSGNKYVPGALASSLVTLYANMRCIVADMTTFYLDAGHTGIQEANRWQNVNLHAWGMGFDSKDGDNYWSDFQIGSRIAPNIYKITVPTSVTGFQIVNAGIENASKNNLSDDLNLTGKTDLLSIQKPADSESKSAGLWASIIDTAFGTATIKAFRQSDGGVICSQAMHTGDGAANNYFVYEEGINFDEDAYLYIDVVSKAIFGDEVTHTLKYDNLVAGAGGKSETYLIKRTDTGYVNIKGGMRRYTFYINRDVTTTSTNPQRQCIAVPQVPYYGNGYYIMPTTDHGNVSGFNEFTKMTASGENSAVYRGFSVSATAQNPTYLYFRSYIDGVDTLYKHFDISRVTGVEIQSKTINNESTQCILKFTSSAKYTIRITGDYVSIVNYSVDDYFYLDPPIGSDTIYTQKTALVLKVPFTTVNSENVHIELELHGPTYLGAYLFIATQAEVDDANNKLDDSQVFATMRGKARTSDDASYVTNLGKAASRISARTISPNSGTVQYYAFILVDFISKDIPSIPSSSLSLYLKSVQEKN